MAAAHRGCERPPRRPSPRQAVIVLPRRARRALLLLVLLLALAYSGCGIIAFRSQPAAGYAYGSGAPLRVAVIDETGGGDWTPAIVESAYVYGAASHQLQFQGVAPGANIVIRVRRYSDWAPPALAGYSFQPGVGGFAAVYDPAGVACNFPPSPLPERCSGEIASVLIYLNDAIPAGSDIEARRERLILHELGHGFGLTRHSPDLALDQLAVRYGWRS